MEKKILSMLENQINMEMYSAYFYMSMANWLTANNYPGFAKWMRVQVKEELLHVAHFMNHIQSRNEKFNLMKIDEPPQSWASVKDIFEASYTHEQKVTKLIGDIFKEARNTLDVQTETFLHWFITEQIEEEKNVADAVTQIEMSGESKEAIFMLDREYGARIFTMPVNIVF